MAKVKRNSLGRCRELSAPQTSIHATCGWLGRVAFSAAIALLIGCGGSDASLLDDGSGEGSSGGSGPFGPGGEGADCVSTKEYFATKVYGQALQPCTGCHSPGGSADQQHAKFMLLRESYPNFMSENLEMLRDYVKHDYDDKQLLLRKALGERSHGGGAVLRADSEEYKILESFSKILRTEEDVECDATAQLGVDLLNTRETVRRAAILLAGRFPTDEEFARAEGGNQAMREVIEGFTREDAFYAHLGEIWNDVLLTNKPVDQYAALLPYGHRPELWNPLVFSNNERNLEEHVNNRARMQLALTQEPLRLIEYIVRNERPFTEVITADYVMANPYLAVAYAFEGAPAVSEENFHMWQRYDQPPIQQRTENGQLQLVQVPRAGVLTTPAFLRRWETSETNRHRQRASVVLKTFLATDVLKLADRPIDATAIDGVQNPILNSQMCTVCHTVMDPVAGGFRGYERNVRLTSYTPRDPWYNDVLPPGFNGEVMPESSYPQAITWLGDRMSKDKRFEVAITQTMFRGLIGDKPLEYPSDRTSADFAQKVRAYDLQNDFIMEVAARFKQNNYNLRSLVVDLVDSAYFRAKKSDGSGETIDAGQGIGRMLSPEQLSRKTKALTGLYFFRDHSIRKRVALQPEDYRYDERVIDDEWRLLYGGIDSSDTTERLDSLGPIMLAAAQHMATMVACRATSFDFTKEPAARNMFRDVEITTVPFLPRANADAPQQPAPGAEEKIRKTMVDLAFRFWGETFSPDSPEIDDMWSLFTDVWKDIESRNFGSQSDVRMWNYRCNGSIDRDAPAAFTTSVSGNPPRTSYNPAYTNLADLPSGADHAPGFKLERDVNYTVRSWQAVITYLLGDYRFLHE